MAIRVHLDRLMLDRRVSLTKLASRIDITNANLSILKTGKARAIRFSTLDALCRELGCQPGDLLEFVDEPQPQDIGEDATLTGRTHSEE
jgi:putative transcriptional regulator